MSGKSLAMMPWFPRDFIAATRHLALAERGAYRELLDYQWEMGVLPKDPTRLARLLVITPEEFTPIWAAIGDKFDDCGHGLVNKRLEEHRIKAVAQRDKKVSGAEKTNANRYGQRVAERGAERVDIVSPPTPSPSPNSESVVVGAQAELYAAGKMSTALRNLGVNVTSMDPTLIAWVQRQLTVEQVCEAVAVARMNPGKEVGNIAPGYLERILSQPARPPPASKRPMTAHERLMEATK
jgi:uncharacterized protein YdaU (DUF1376 family)